MNHLYKNLLCFSLILSGFTACVSLDTPPYDRETDITFWSTDPNAALSVLNTCYNYLGNMDEQLFSEAMTDNAYVKRDYTLAIGNGSYSTADGYVKSVWDGRYAGIFYCNQLLANIDKVPGLSEELKKRYIGEAKVLRAYNYYELYTRFGGVPYFTNPISIEESHNIERTDKDKVVENIIKELDEVISGNYLPAAYAGEEVGRITSWAAKAIKAKICLFESDWQQVKAITEDFIQNGPFSLFPNYESLFSIHNENNAEVILDVQYTPSLKEHRMLYNIIPPSIGGYSLIAPLQSLVDNYIMLNGKSIDSSGSNYNKNTPYVNRDPRLAATIIYTGNGYEMSDATYNVIDCEAGRDKFQGEPDATVTGYYIKKWWDNTYRADHRSGLNPILIRYADILLMNAEAHAELGSLDANVWAKTVYLIRQRAGFTEQGALGFPAGTSKNDLISLVRQERRSELAFEGHRRTDIIRWRIAEEVLNGYCHGLYTGEAVGTDEGHIRIEHRQFDPEKHYLWPIPQAERDLNKNLIQNNKW